QEPAPGIPEFTVSAGHPRANLVAVEQRAASLWRPAVFSGRAYGRQWVIEAAASQFPFDKLSCQMYSDGVVNQVLSNEAVGVVGDREGLAAILSPLRRQMLENLARPDSASGLSRRLGIPRQKINYHLRKLEEAGLVELVEEKMRRGCLERMVRVTARAFVVSPEFLEGLAADPEAIADRYSSAYLVAAAARMVRQVADQREKSEKAG